MPKRNVVQEIKNKVSKVSNSKKKKPKHRKAEDLPP